MSTSAFETKAVGKTDSSTSSAGATASPSPDSDAATASRNAAVNYRATICDETGLPLPVVSLVLSYLPRGTVLLRSFAQPGVMFDLLTATWMPSDLPKLEGSYVPCPTEAHGLLLLKHQHASVALDLRSSQRRNLPAAPTTDRIVAAALGPRVFALCSDRDLRRWDWHSLHYLALDDGTAAWRDLQQSVKGVRGDRTSLFAVTWRGGRQRLALLSDAEVAFADPATGEWDQTRVPVRYLAEVRASSADSLSGAIFALSSGGRVWVLSCTAAEPAWQRLPDMPVHCLKGFLYCAALPDGGLLACGHALDGFAEQSDNAQTWRLQRAGTWREHGAWEQLAEAPMPLPVTGAQMVFLPLQTRPDSLDAALAAAAAPKKS